MWTLKILDAIYEDESRSPSMSTEVAVDQTQCLELSQQRHDGIVLRIKLEASQ